MWILKNSAESENMNWFVAGSTLAFVHYSMSPFDVVFKFLFLFRPFNSDRACSHVDNMFLDSILEDTTFFNSLPSDSDYLFCNVPCISSGYAQ